MLWSNAKRCSRAVVERSRTRSGSLGLTRVRSAALARRLVGSARWRTTTAATLGGQLFVLFSGMRFTWQPAGVGGGTRLSRRGMLRQGWLAERDGKRAAPANRCGCKRARRRRQAERCYRRGERLTSINACECSRSAEVSSCRSPARLVRSFVRSFIYSSASAYRRHNRYLNSHPFFVAVTVCSFSIRVRYCSLSDQLAPTPPPLCAPPPLWETYVCGKERKRANSAG